MNQQMTTTNGAQSRIVRRLYILLFGAILLLVVAAYFVIGVSKISADREAVRQASFRELARFNVLFIRRHQVSQTEYLKELRSFSDDHSGWSYDEYLRATEDEAGTELRK